MAAVATVAAATATRVAAELPYLSASRLAAAIGQHPYVPHTEALLEVCAASGTWKATVAATKARLCAKTPQAAFHALLAATPALATVVRDATARATAATATADDIAAAIGDARADHDLLAAAAASAVAMRRGVVCEAPALDAFAARRRVHVGARNARMAYLRTPHYTLGGRVDGVQDDGAIIEAKTRMRWVDAPPAYDLLQLRAYLAIAHANGAKEPNGVLLETFPDGRTRETRVTHDLDAWAAVHDALVAHVCVPFAAMTPARIEELVRATCVCL